MPMTSLKGSRLISSQLEPLDNSPANWEIPLRSRDTLPPNASNNTPCDAMSSSSSTSVAAAAATAAVTAVAATKTQAQQQSRDAPKSGNSTQQATKNLDLDDNELKNLLDEAYSYKGPKDKENKSVLFKELLHKAETEELEDQQRDSYHASRHFRGNNRRHHTGGSLQDLVESVNQEQLFECDYVFGSRARRIQQNLRITKQLTAQSTSVSSRQREGGSLPNNVNASILAGCYPVSSLSLSKYPKVAAKNSVKTKPDSVQHDYERNSKNYQRNAFIGVGGGGGGSSNSNSNSSGVNSNNSSADDGVTFRTLDTTQSSGASTSAALINPNDKHHTIIDIGDLEETRHLLAHDSLAQDTSEAHRDDGTELVSIKKQRPSTMNYLSTNAKDIGETSRQACHVDQSIPFLARYPPAETAQFTSNIYRKSTVDTKYPGNKHVQLNPPVNQNKLDENGNAIPPKPTTIALTSNHSKLMKPKRSNKADRNTTTWTVPQGSEYNIDSIVAFIENKETNRKTNIINVNKNNLSATERNRKEKKNSGNSKKEVSRLKKSTSMEELKSSSKIEEEQIAQSERAQVSLRQKHSQNQQNAQKRSTTADGKDSSAKQQVNKRGERRSWGTEELNDLESIDDRESRKQKDAKPNTTKTSNNNTNKKTEQFASTNASIESIPTIIEAADFQVVAKKKKTKKRQILEEAKAKQQLNQRDQMQTHGRNPINNNTMNSGNKYQPSSSYTNDREIYVNSLMAKENRRKSTSSVPPSDKSDSSDLDSVHSLPIESTTPCPSIISYAEIARKANQPEKLTNVNVWPPVSQNGKNSESPENSNTSTSSSTVSSRSQASNRSQDTIKASSPIEEKIQPSLDDSKILETPKAQSAGSGEHVKNQLQKSKSCDSEKYTATVNLDQFPGLEKTVKPQKSQPNFASVLTSPPPPPPPQLPPSNEKSSNKGQVTKKSPQSTEKSPPTIPVDNSLLKESAIKVQKPMDDRIDSRPIGDINSSKLVFVQNSAKAEEIVNSDTSNVFVAINAPSIVKKTKKSHANTIATQANMSSKNNHSQRTARQTAVIFSDHDTNHENVSPLLFGDFNDDILQLMKQDENHIDDEIPNGQPSITDSVAGNYTNAFESADYHAMNNDCKQSKPNNQIPMMSSKSDPAFASIQRTTNPTESHEVVDFHQKTHSENHVGHSTELSNKKSNITKRTSLNKINVNNNTTSDVVSNQTLNNNNNNISLGEKTVKSVHSSQTICDSDSLNNNINTQMNDKNRNHTMDGNVIKSQQQQQHHQHSDAGVTKSLNAHNNVNSTVSKASNQSVAAHHQQKPTINHDSVNSKTLDNFSNGPKVVPSSNKRPITENSAISVNSHPANVPHENASYAENRVSHVNHNHNDIVHFVGSAWEEVKFGGANYFSGQ